MRQRLRCLTVALTVMLLPLGMGCVGERGIEALRETVQEGKRLAWVYLRPQEPSGSLRIVAAYDMTALSAYGAGDEGEDEQDPAGPHPVAFRWGADGYVSRSCQPHRGPSLVGLPEMAAVARHRMPMLALVVEHQGLEGAPPRQLRLDQLSIYVDDGAELREGSAADQTIDPMRILQPAVLPERMGVIFRLPGDLVESGAEMVGPTLLFQMTAQLCGEHKTGRAWVGAARRDWVREAFMLQEPGYRHEERRERFFLAQGVPIPPLLGPMTWGVGSAPLAGDPVNSERYPPWMLAQIGGSTVAPSYGGAFNETDIFNVKAPTLQRGASYPSARPQVLSFQSEPPVGCRPQRIAGHLKVLSSEAKGAAYEPCLRPVALPPQVLEVDLTGALGAVEEASVSMKLTYLRDDALTESALRSQLEDVELDLLDGAPLFPGGGRTTEEGVATGRRGTLDLISHLPRYLPYYTAPQLKGERGYSLILIPEWQILRSLETLGAVYDARVGTESDAVGYLLENLNLLPVQYRGDFGDGATGEGEGEAPEWEASDKGEGTFAGGVDALEPDLIAPFHSEAQRWGGHFPGLWAVDAPIFLQARPGGERISWAQHAAVFESRTFAPQVLAALLIAMGLFLGLPRLPELWQSPPVERAAYWPNAGEDRRAEVKAPKVKGEEDES